MSARLRAFVALPALLLTLLTTVVATGVSTAPSADAATRHHHRVTRVDRIHHARNIALRQIGDPYSYGAAGPRRFDCSGLIFFSYRHAGFSVPRTSRAQAGHVRHITKRHLRTGDFMFFTDGGGVYHVGIFTGWDNGRRQIVHAPYSGTRVRRDPIWTNRWFPGTLRR